MIEKIKLIWRKAGLLVVLAIVATLLLGLKFLIKPETLTTPLSVVSVKPENGATDVSLKPSFQLILNQDVDGGKFEVTVSPTANFGVDQIEKRVINVTAIDPLAPSREYEITLHQGRRWFIRGSLLQKNLKAIRLFSLK